MGVKSSKLISTSLYSFIVPVNRCPVVWLTMSSLVMFVAVSV